MDYYVCFLIFYYNLVIWQSNDSSDFQFFLILTKIIPFSKIFKNIAFF
jgi:hypothetical protein